MNPTLATLSALLRETLSDPRAGMRRVLDIGLPVEARWQALALVAVVSAILSQISIFLGPMGQGGGMMPGMGGSPVRVVILQVLVLALIVFGVDRIGRAMGGRGSFVDALLVVVWLQVVMIALQLVQVVALILVPPLAALIGLASVALFFWMLTSFVTELHGFASRGRVFGVVLLSFFAMAFVLAFLLTLLGVAPGMEG